MATLNFQFRSIKINAPFTARFQFSNSDKISETNPFGLDFVEGKTEIFVFSNEEIMSNPAVNGKRFWTKYKKYKGSDVEILKRKNRILIEQDDLRSFILTKSETVSEYTKEWLQSSIKEFYNNKKRDADKSVDAPLSLIWHFDNYVKLKTNKIAERTVMKLNDTKNIVLNFQSFLSIKKGYDYIINVDEICPELQYELEAFLNSKKYAHNTIAKTIKIIKTICNYSVNYGIQLHRQYGLVGLSYEEKDVVYLSFEELQQIKNTELPKEYENARDWLYISCFMGQRISDFMRFDKSLMRREGGDYVVDFTQSKTDKKISLLLHPEVVSILAKREMNFPEPISEQRYNEEIKTVCQLAGITEIISGSVLEEVEKGIWRNVKGKYSKYKLVGSHIGRKSYCTNFYSKIPTSLILEVSGHSEERVLLSYIGKKDNTNSRLIKNYYSQIDITKD